MPKPLRRIIFIISVLALVGVLLFWPKQPNNTSSEKMKIISTNFASYDIARALTKNLDVDLAMLIKPGADVHHYDPTPQDIIKIENSDVFIYVGGESEEWVNRINKGGSTAIQLSNSVKLIDESSEGILEAETEKDNKAEKDEHIWTSPTNYQQMLNYAKDILVEKYPNYATVINQNYNTYLAELQQIDQDYQNTPIKQPIIVADRFPFLYLANNYQLKYFAAFPGCAEQTEADANTIAKLIDIVKNEDVKTIYTIELSNAKIAQTISSSTQAEIRSLHSGHNITQDDFDNGLTMAQIYRHNLDALKETK